jgi:VWFA-related protein
MPVNHTCIFPKSALTLVLAGSFCGLILWSSARAQEGGAGQNPAASTSERESQQTATKSSETESRIRVPVNMVSAPVTVINSKGDYVFDLQEKDFEVLDNGVRQHIEQFGLEQQPLAAVIVVETNSTSGPLLEEVRPLGPVFSSLMLGPQGEAAVVTYGEEVRVVQDFTQDSAPLETALRGLEARGGSVHLNDALARAIELLENRPKENRRVIIAFSDGHDIGSETHKEEVVQRAVNAGITIYGLGFNPGRALLSRQPKAPPQNTVAANMGLPAPPNTAPQPSNVENTYYDQPLLPIVPLILASGEMIRSTVAKTALEFYAGYTGGVCYAHWSSKSVQGELNKIASEIQSQYEIAYVPRAPSVDGFHRIEIHVDRRGVKVRTRAGYFLGGTSP